MLHVFNVCGFLILSRPFLHGVRVNKIKTNGCGMDASLDKLRENAKGECLTNGFFDIFVVSSKIKAGALNSLTAKIKSFL